MKYKVIEIFKSIQGEGFNSGKEVIFIRLASCNLNCKWCDTNWKNDKRIKQMTDDEIFRRVEKLSCGSIIITGGEPLIWDLENLVNTLQYHEYWVGIETNGLLLDKVTYRPDWISCSPKYLYENKYTKKISDCIKQKASEIRIVAESNTIDFIRFTQKFDNRNLLYLSPMDINGKKNQNDIINKDVNFDIKLLLKIYDRLKYNGWIISFQLHKLLKVR